MSFSEFCSFPADLVRQDREEDISMSFLLMFYLILHFISLCLHFLGWAISQRYWTGVGHPYPICSVFANCHSHWWPDWYSGALPSLGQRSLPPQSPRGELVCSLFPFPHNGQDCSPVPPVTPNVLLLLFSWVYTFFMLDFYSYWKKKIGNDLYFQSEEVKYTSTETHQEFYLVLFYG